MVIICNSIFSQNWEWAKAGLGNGEGEAISIDNSGNIYITGVFVSPSITFGTTTLNNSNSPNINGNLYVVKYDGQGNMKWAKSGSGNNNGGYSITTDNLGYTYVTGSFNGQMTFNSYTINGVSGVGNFFILKLDSLGNVMWGKSAGLNIYASGNSIIHDSHNSVYVVGNYKSSSLIFGNDTLINKGYEDIFVVKYNSSTGNVIWAKSFGNSLMDYGNAITVNRKGEIYFTGYYSSHDITFDSINLHNVGSLLGGNGFDIYMTKCDSSGNIIWAKSYGGVYDDLSFGICVDKTDNIYFTGRTNSLAISFDTINVLNPSVGENIFIAKCNSLGDISWLKMGFVNGRGCGFGLAIDPYNNLYASGGTHDNASIDFGDVILNAPSANCVAGRCDPMYVIKYDSLGNLQCSSYLSSGGDDISGLCVDKSGYVYVTGDYLANPFIIGNDSFPLVGTESIFTAKFYCCENPKLHSSNLLENICKGDSIRISLSGALNYNWTSSSGSSQNISLISGAPTSNITYTAIGSFASCSDTITFNINVNDCNEYLNTIPNVFTPNNDSINDVWHFNLGTGNVLKGLKIYNRWGNLITEAEIFNTNYIKWDGHTSSGEPVSAGVYFFILQYIDYNGDEHKKNGCITLIK